MSLVPLADVVARELARVDVPGRAHRGVALAALPVPRLRQLGRELDTSASLLPAVLDGETPVLVRCLLDLTAVYQHLDGERGVAAVARIEVDPVDLRWRDVQILHPYRRPLSYASDDEPRVAQQRPSRKPPPGYIGVGEALDMIGLARASSGVLRAAIDRGELHAVQSAEGRHFVRPADVETWNKTLRRRGRGARRPAGATA